MGSEWKPVCLSDVVSILGDGLHGTPEYSELGEYYFINGNNLDDGNVVIKESTKKVDEDQFLKYKKDLNDRTVLVSINGTIGNVAYYKGEKVVLGKSACYFNVLPEISKEYIRYVLASPHFQSYIEQQATGTTIKNVSLKTMREYSFLLPPKEYQDGVSNILGNIDKKIELNRQINTTLESMAQTLFKSWFVDFDPVIDNALAAGNPIPPALEAKAEKRRALRAQQTQSASPNADATNPHPPLPEEIKKLFPSSFVFTEELGWVPEGWEVKPLDQVAHYQNGLALQKFRPESEDDFLPVVKIAQLKKGFADGEEKASPQIKPECIIDNGDVVFSWSGSLMVDVWCGGKAALNQHLFKVTSRGYPMWFYLYFTKLHLEEFQRIAADKAVTMGHIKREHLNQAYCAIPEDGLITNLSCLIKPLIDRAILIRLQSKELAESRDRLLPKLLSGQLLKNIGVR